MYFAGIGSRKTPSEILVVMTALAKKLCSAGHILRSGGADGADGADTAFWSGCCAVGGKMEIFLPWDNFNGLKADGVIYFQGHSTEAREIAMDILRKEHWNRLTDGGRKLHARNVHQVLGNGCNKPAARIICWTEGGKLIGGTATALKLARKHSITIRNLAIKEDLELIMKYLNP